MTDPFRFATSATPGARHDLLQIQAIAKMLGTPNMPHQNHIARVASEHHPDRPNQFRYPIVVWTGPRQIGKSQEYTEIQLDRSIRISGHQSWATAQTGLRARALWKGGLLAAVHQPTAVELGRELNPHLAAQVRKVDLSAGSAGIRFRNGALAAPFAPGPKALDSTSNVNLVGVDEAFAFDIIAGSELMGSIGPTQNVAPWHQLWIFSTKGGRRSTWFNEWLKKGRAAVNDPDAEIAFFESSADPGCDPENPASLAFHPAIGYTTTLEDLWSFRQGLSLAEWRRAYLNLDAEEGADYALDPASFAGLAGVTADQLPPLDECILAVDLAIDRSAATIAAAWPDPSRPAAALVVILASRPGTEWVPAALAKLDELGPRKILADPTGPTRSLIADMAALDEPIRLSPTSTRDYASACQWMLDAIPSGQIHHDGTSTLTDQARDLAVKNLGGVQAFDPQNSTGPIDSLRAVALAAHRAATTTTELQVY